MALASASGALLLLGGATAGHGARKPTSADLHRPCRRGASPHYRAVSAPAATAMTGDGQGENAQWIEPKPRDFTAAIVQVPLDPLRHAADRRGSVQLGGARIRDHQHAALVRAHASRTGWIWWPTSRRSRPRWKTQGAGHARSRSRRRRRATMESILHGRELFQKMECWKCHGPAGHGDGPSASTLTDSKDNPIRPYNFSTGSRFKCGSHQRGSVPHLHDGPGRHADAVLRRQPPAGTKRGTWCTSSAPCSRSQTPESRGLAGLAPDARGRAQAHRPRQEGQQCNRFHTSRNGARCATKLAASLGCWR